MFVAGGAQTPSLSTLSLALPSAPGWTTTSRRVSVCGLPLLLLLSNTGGSHAPPKQTNEILGTHSYPRVAGPPSKCPFLDLPPLLTVSSPVQLW